MPRPFRHLSLDRPLAVLDTEATGLDPRADRLVEVAVVVLAPGRRPALFQRTVDPGVPIPPAATAVHGLADADVAGRPRFGAIARPLADLLGGCDLAGFNLRRFDLPLLCAEFARAGVAFSPLGRSVVDAMAIYHRREPRDLAAAVRTYCGEGHDRAHRALSDAVAAAAVLDAQVGRYLDLPDTPAGLHEVLTDVDLGGQFRTEAGRVVFAAGKHRGRPLEEVARRDPGYLRWWLARDIFADARGLVERALADVAGGDRS